MMRTYPAGITWERKGRQRYICTIRREAETVYDLNDMAGLNPYGSLAYGSLGYRCPCCGQPYQPSILSMLGLGGLGHLSGLGL